MFPEQTRSRMKVTFSLSKEGKKTWISIAHAIVAMKQSILVIGINMHIRYIMVENIYRGFMINLLHTPIP